MQHFIPGTVIPLKEGASEDCFSLISPLFTVTGGLTLSQVKALTGLNSSTIQNWVKRGWVKNPDGKRYGEEQVMRIIIINMMRGSMQLEQIAFLMNYINGSVEDRADDILPDRELFNILCSIIAGCERKSVFDSAHLNMIIDEQINKADIHDALSRKKLHTALRAMVLAILSSEIKELAQEAFGKLA